jgi:hypothetical protein
MAVAIQFEFRGTTIAKYDALNECTGFLPGGPMPTGGLFHWVTKTDDGFLTMDVWESREAFDQFFNKMVLPRYQDVGITDPPEVQYFEVHNYLSGTGWRS